MAGEQDHFDWKAFLGEHPLFGELRKKDIATLADAENSQHREFKRDDVIFRAGEIGNSFFLIGEGSVNVELASEDSSSTVISTLYKGDYFGEMSAIDSQHGRAATILANEDCKLLEIRSKPFQVILKANPELEFELLSMLAARLRHVNDYLLNNTRLSYDTKFSLLAEKIESQSKVVDASLNASQAVFEQTKVRTSEIINAAERGRSRITWVMSTLTAGFTLLLMVLGFLGYERINMMQLMATQIEGVAESVQTSQQEIDDSMPKINQALEKASGLESRIEKLNTAIEESADAKRILFQTFIPTFRLQVEEEVRNDSGLNPEKMGRQILRANDELVTTWFFRELYFIIEEYQEYIQDNLEEIQDSGTSREEREQKQDENRIFKKMISFCSSFMYLYLADTEKSAENNALARFLANYLLLVTYALDDYYLEQINKIRAENPGVYPADDFDNRLALLVRDSSGDEGDLLKELAPDFLEQLKDIGMVSGERNELIASNLE